MGTVFISPIDGVTKLARCRPHRYAAKTMMMRTTTPPAAAPAMTGAVDAVLDVVAPLLAVSSLLVVVVVGVGSGCVSVYGCM